MKLTKTLIAAGLSVGLLTGCALDRTAIITVNGEPVTKAQYEKIYNAQINSPQLKQFAPEAKGPNSYIGLMTKDRVINELIVKTLLEQQIKKHKITISAADIKAKRKEIVDKLGSEERLQEVLKQNGVTEAKLREDLTNEIKIDKLVMATSDTKVSDKDVSDFYNKNKASFNRPETVRASHILIEANPVKIKEEIIDADKNGKLTAADIDKKVKEKMDEKMALAKKVREEAAKSPDKFADLVKKYSDDKGSVPSGGDLGFFPREAMVKPFADAAFSLKPNVVSDVVVTEYGNHIIIVKDRAAKGLQPLDKVKDEIKTFLEQQKKVEALQKMFAGLRAEAKVEYIDKSFDPQNIQNALRNNIQQNAQSAAPQNSADKK